MNLRILFSHAKRKNRTHPTEFIFVRVKVIRRFGGNVFINEPRRMRPTGPRGHWPHSDVHYCERSVLHTYKCLCERVRSCKLLLSNLLNSIWGIFGGRLMNDILMCMVLFPLNILMFENILIIWEYLLRVNLCCKLYGVIWLSSCQKNSRKSMLSYMVGIPPIRTKHFESRFIMRSAKHWNSLPVVDCLRNLEPECFQIKSE